MRLPKMADVWKNQLFPISRKRDTNLSFSTSFHLHLLFSFAVLKCVCPNGARCLLYMPSCFYCCRDCALYLPTGLLSSIVSVVWQKALLSSLVLWAAFWLRTSCAKNILEEAREPSLVFFSKSWLPALVELVPTQLTRFLALTIFSYLTPAFVSRPLLCCLIM